MSVVRKSLIAGSLAMAVSVVGFFEGRELIGYFDPVGIPTVCYGHTTTAVVSQARSSVECEQLLQQDLGVALHAVDRALPSLPPATRAALGSFVYNVGTGAFQSSTLLHKARSGDLIGACNELPRWVYAGGRKLNGLVRRREAERELCLEGLRNDSNPYRGVRGPVAFVVVGYRQTANDDYQGFGRAGALRSEGHQLGRYATPTA